LLNNGEDKRHQTVQRLSYIIEDTRAWIRCHAGASGTGCTALLPKTQFLLIPKRRQSNARCFSTLGGGIRRPEPLIAAGRVVGKSREPTARTVLRPGDAAGV
jgi:hypothetical protein